MGKTSVAVAIMKALAGRKVAVGAAKVGPDFIDPAYHELATGRPSYNLDPVMTGAAGVRHSTSRAARGCELLLIEGVMGLFDGTHLNGPPAPGGLPEGSTAGVAAELGLPVLLVVDASGTSHSVAATVHGFRSWSSRVRLVGVVANRIGSDSHLEMVESLLSATGVPLVGHFRRDELPHRPSRHLGLNTVAEDAASAGAWVAELGDAAERSLDLGRIMALCTPLPAPEPAVGRRRASAVVAFSSGPAASFIYRENIERLAEAGFETVPFDPRFEAPPAAAGLVWLHGGYPELFLEEIATNVKLLASLRERVAEGAPTVAECGGHQLLGRSLNGVSMAGALPFASWIGERPVIGYRRLTAGQPVLGGLEKAAPVAHEFHYGRSDAAGEGLLATAGAVRHPGGFGTASLLSSYHHLHLGSASPIATNLLAAALRYAEERSG